MAEPSVVKGRAISLQHGTPLSPPPLSGGHRDPTDCGSGLFLPFLLMPFCPPDSSAVSAESGGRKQGDCCRDP